MKLIFRMECHQLKNYLNFVDENIEKLTKCIESFPIIISQPNLSENYDKYLREKTQELQIRFLCTKGWFMRCEDSNKFKFFQLLVLSTNENSLISIFNQYYIYLSKDLVYANVSQDPEISPSIKNPYLDLYVLQNVMINDLDLYILSPDDVKVELFTGLFDMCSDSLKASILKYISNTLALYEAIRQRKQLQNEENNIEAKKNRNSIFGQSIDSIEKKKRAKNELKTLYVARFDNSSSQNGILTNSLMDNVKIWQSKIDDYKKSLGIYVPAKTDEKDQEGKKKKGKKEKKAKAKKGKKDKTSKDCLDYIQLLPIWIIKPIFNLVEAQDQKSMNLNKYWKFLIKNNKQDIVTRQNLNNAIQKLQQEKKNITTIQIDKTKNEGQRNISPIKIHNRNKNIVYKKRGKIVTKSLLTEIIEENEEFNKLKGYSCFPRVI